MVARPVLHVTAAMGWVGGQLLLSVVVLPVLRRQVDPLLRGPLVRTTARRFALVANAVLLPTLVATCVALATHRGVTWETLGGPGYGRLLSIKLVLVVCSCWPQSMACRSRAGPSVLDVRRADTNRGHDHTFVIQLSRDVSPTELAQCNQSVVTQGAP